MPLVYQLNSEGGIDRRAIQKGCYATDDNEINFVLDQYAQNLTKVACGHETR